MFSPVHIEGKGSLRKRTGSRNQRPLTDQFGSLKQCRAE